MKQYAVVISALVTKEITVTAESEEKAIDEANAIFTVANDEWPEKYEQETHLAREIGQEG